MTEKQGLLDGPYWVVNGGGETLGVTEDAARVEEVLKDAFIEDFGLPAGDRKSLSTRIKFDQIRLVRLGLDVPGFFATNEKKL